MADALAARIAADPGAVVDAFVTLPPPVTDAQLSAIQARGVTIGRVYAEEGLVYAWGPGAAVLSLARVPGALYVSGNEKIEFHLNTATVTTNARDVWDARSTSATAVKVGGVIVDGSGVGVAVIDSGIDATHPDLAPAVAENYKWACGPLALSGNCAAQATLHAATDNPGAFRFPAETCDGMRWEATPNSDTTTGHGTHVAGIVAGRGIASGGRHTGAAPGATLYGLGVGDGDSILFSVDAFKWVLCHHDTVTPAIRIVTNSWGQVSPTGAEIPFTPNDPISVMTNSLVSKGIVVVWSASNNGGDGSSNQVNSYGKNPTPGVVTVANYEDQDTGTRTGAISSTSSRGRAAETPGEQWPDVAAPGMGILSARAKTGATVDALGHPLSGGGRFSCCDLTQNEYMADYVSISGTSMAAPHVTGIIALLLQANPSLTPAQVENILEDTATPLASAGAYVADPTNPGTSTNHIAGHGLVDALAAVKDARVGTTTGAGSPQPTIVSATSVFAAGVINPQAAAHAKWVVPAGAVGFAKLAFGSVDTAVGDGTQVRFQIDGNPPVTGTITAGRVDVDTTISAGAHVVEAHVLTGGVWRAFDSFLVEAV